MTRDDWLRQFEDEIKDSRARRQYDKRLPKGAHPLRGRSPSWLH